MPFTKDEKLKRKKLQEQGLRICSKKDCEHGGEPQPIFNFNKNSSKKSGLRSACQSCDRKMAKNWAEKNKPKKEKNIKQWGEKNKINHTKEYYDSIDSNYSKICYQCGNKKNISEFGRSKERLDGYRSLCKNCVRENRIKHKDKRNEWERNRIKNDLDFRVRKKFSHVFRQAVRESGISKNGRSCFELLGYTFEDYKQHMESLFEYWMTWENQGVYNSAVWNDNDPSTFVWNLDHIIPQSKLPYDSFEHPNFKICWALSNLRPYSAKKNIEEGNRRELTPEMQKIIQGDV